MNLTSKDIDAIAELAKEAQTLRNENAKLKLAAKNLWVQLQETNMNIDVSTIRPGKRSEARWGSLRVENSKLLTLTRDVVQP